MPLSFLDVFCLKNQIEHTITFYIKFLGTDLMRSPLITKLPSLFNSADPTFRTKTFFSWLGGFILPITTVIPGLIE
ncbi:hypothetical protein Lpp17_0222 [Lacticaseibacillus paracasei subsp. paracasei Lpp17]|nr:hypothetical protein Lpp17_0222 [Lacticaseibacillus paracasei subsp. paracasei Lpp17]